MTSAKKLPFFFGILTLVKISQTSVNSRKSRPPSGGGILDTRKAKLNDKIPELSHVGC